jgi:hypothetical protein
MALKVLHVVNTKGLKSTSNTTVKQALPADDFWQRCDKGSRSSVAAVPKACPCCLIASRWRWRQRRNRTSLPEALSCCFGFLPKLSRENGS